MTQEDRERRAVELGLVVGVHGLRGELRVRWLGDGPESLLELSRMTLTGPDGARDYEIENVGSGRSGELRVRLAGVTTREEAEALRGRGVRGEAAALPEGEHYWYELVGCDVVSDSGERVGRVREIWETGAHDVLVVERPGGATCLIPTARELMREVDVAARRVVVEERPGLFDPADRGAAPPRPEDRSAGGGSPKDQSPRGGSEECSGST